MITIDLLVSLTICVVEQEQPKIERMGFIWLYAGYAKMTKIYEGSRTIDGITVSVDGKPLDERYNVHRFTKMGFEWAFEGKEPQQLALAVLVDHLRDGQKALGLSKAFMCTIIANLDNDWLMTSEDVERAITEIRPN